MLREKLENYVQFQIQILRGRVKNYREEKLKKYCNDIYLNKTHGIIQERHEHICLLIELLGGKDRCARPSYNKNLRVKSYAALWNPDWQWREKI